MGEKISNSDVKIFFFCRSSTIMSVNVLFFGFETFSFQKVPAVHALPLGKTWKRVNMLERMLKTQRTEQKWKLKIKGFSG